MMSEKDVVEKTFRLTIEEWKRVQFKDEIIIVLIWFGNHYKIIGRIFFLPLLKLYKILVNYVF